MVNIGNGSKVAAARHFQALVPVFVIILLQMYAAQIATLLNSGTAE